MTGFASGKLSLIDPVVSWETSPQGTAVFVKNTNETLQHTIN